MAKNNSLIARNSEIKLLKKAMESSKSEFIALYGRRRIGKTYLVHEYFKESPYFFEFTGAKELPTRSQIKNFLRAIKKYFALSTETEPANWSDALDLIRKTIETSPKSIKSKKIIFFDELPWLASKKSGFLESLDYFWNSYLSKRNDILLIVCGSAANWMISEIINNKGGLHNRLTLAPIALSPFNLSETQEYLQSKNIDFNYETISEIYMATGGVAYYLDQINRGESAAQFINNCFFKKEGTLRNEFDRLFQSLFDNYEVHISVIRNLASHPSGLTYPELAKALKISTGGTFTKILTELEMSDFIYFNPKIGNKKREGIYQLADEYTFFYLTWVESLGRTFKDSSYWQKQIGKPRYYSWLGHAFESLSFKHSDKIIKAIGISGLTTSIFGYRNKSVQIDMVIDRSDKSMNLCEMKYTSTPFEMTAIEAQKIKLRKQELLASQKVRKQVYVTLITPFPAVKNKHYLSIVDLEINLNAFFEIQSTLS
jgi:AAA+ ATPase superfamily predicted ATPase